MRLHLLVLSAFARHDVVQISKKFPTKSTKNVRHTEEKLYNFSNVEKENSTQMNEFQVSGKLVVPKENETHFPLVYDKSNIFLPP